MAVVKLLFLSFLLSTVSLLGADPWPGVEYAEVRAFVWEPTKTPANEALILDDFTFIAGVINKEGSPLTAEQVQRLFQAQSRRYAERRVAGCYRPHNAFVFYDAQKKPVAFLEICFDCLGARSRPRDKEADPDFVALATIFEELKLPFGEYKTVQEFQTKTAWMYATSTAK